MSHIVIHSGTHVAKIPDHVNDKIASPVNCALATMVNAVSGLVGKNPYRNTVAVIQVNPSVLCRFVCSSKNHKMPQGTQIHNIKVWEPWRIGGTRATGGRGRESGNWN